MRERVAPMRRTSGSSARFVRWRYPDIETARREREEAAPQWAIDGPHGGAEIPNEYLLIVARKR